MRYRVYPLYHLLKDLDLDDVGTEMGNNTSEIYEYAHIDGKLWPSYYIDPSLSGEHSSTVIIFRDTLYEVSTDCSSALYTQAQIDQLSELIGEYAIRLVGDQGETLRNIML
jgi:hypothetical protein